MGQHSMQRACKPHATRPLDGASHSGLTRRPGLRPAWAPVNFVPLSPPACPAAEQPQGAARGRCDAARTAARRMRILLTGCRRLARRSQAVRQEEGDALERRVGLGGGAAEHHAERARLLRRLRAAGRRQHRRRAQVRRHAPVAAARALRRAALRARQQPRSGLAAFLPPV